MKKILPFLLLALLLSGCDADANNRVDINQDAGQILPVSALSIDRCAGGFQMTVESIRQDSLDGDVSPGYFTVQAADFPALFDRADELLASRLYLSHAQVILVSQSVPQNDLPALVDSLLARPDARLTLRIAVAQGATPDELLRAEALTEGIPGMALAALLDKRASDGSLADSPLFRILDCLCSGQALSLPVLTPNLDGHTAPGGSLALPPFTGGDSHA